MICDHQQFMAELLPGKLLAIDYGGRRIGLALSDRDRNWSSPWTTMDNHTSIYQQLKQLIQQEAVAGIVVGLPLENVSQQPEDYIDLKLLNQFPTDQRYQNSRLNANLVAIFNFILQLKAVLPTNIPLVLENEAYTSADAEAFLQENFTLNRKQRTAKLDAIAASYILQRTLEYLHTSSVK